MAAVSLGTRPFTSAHQVIAAAFASVRDGGVERDREIALGHPTRPSTTPFDSGSAASQKSGRKRQCAAKGMYSGYGTTTLAAIAARGQVMRSARTIWGTPRRFLEALRQQRERRRPALVVPEAHETGVAQAQQRAVDSKIGEVAPLEAVTKYLAAFDRDATKGTCRGGA
jgi:hypothetical protein